MPVDPALLAWLLDSEPAVRWRVERDLAGAPREVWDATRSSFHSTLNALTGLLAFEAASGGATRVPPLAAPSRSTCSSAA